MDNIPVISNRAARRVFLHLQGLTIPPHTRLDKQSLLALIHQMGFVQIDSINTVERAHHMILFSRNQTYQPKHLRQLLEDDGALFENWTHDASIIPASFYPYWRHKFDREADQLRERWRTWRREGFEEVLEETLHHVNRSGPVMSRDFQKPKQSGEGGGDGWWDWHPQKTALEYLWRTGDLCVARREGFQKVYDLSHKVIADDHFQCRCDHGEFVDWACSSALDRLGFAAHGEIAAFWDLVSPAEAKVWCEKLAGNELMQVLVEPADGDKPRLHYAWADCHELLDEAPEPPARLRVLSPFDPVVRDRKRLSRLFGFEYRIEVFVPEAKRQYGYYVFPLIEGGSFVGRIDMKHDRKTGIMGVRGVWMEPRWKLNDGRLQRLEAELERIRRFTGAEKVVFADGWRR
ncbi:MAG: winged helix-turn-helix domain-containing protein [Hyphomicrobiales bacterium]